VTAIGSLIWISFFIMLSRGVYLNPQMGMFLKSSWSMGAPTCYGQTCFQIVAIHSNWISLQQIGAPMSNCRREPYFVPQNLQSRPPSHKIWWYDVLATSKHYCKTNGVRRWSGWGLGSLALFSHGKPLY
jgi:hypothetical protein